MEHDAMKRTLVSLTTALVLLLGSDASALVATQDSLPRNVELERELALQSALIGSRSELDRFLRATSVKDSPLSAMPLKNREAFLSSLTFTPAGLASFRTDVFEGLRAGDAHCILALFGMQHMVAAMQGLLVEDEVDDAILKHYAIAPNSKCGELIPYGGQPATLSGSLERGEGAMNVCPDHIMRHRCESRGSCVSASRYICNLRTC
jgi:hypothetical protein